MTERNLIKSVGVFCGSSVGFQQQYRDVAFELGEKLASLGWELIYGGSSVGIMRVLADAALDNGGEVTGIMPKVLVEKNVHYDRISNFILCKSMSDRKELMIEKSDCFVALPGGFGTIDEITEVLVHNQLNKRIKPIALLNVDNFYGNFLAHLDNCVLQGFVRIEHRRNIIVADNVESLLEKIHNFIPVIIDSKWVEKIIEDTNTIIKNS